MKKPSKNKISKRKSSDKFRARLKKYSEVLSLVARDYADKRLVPEPPNPVYDEDGSADLFRWARDTQNKRYAQAVERRRATIVQLREELHSILETSPRENDLKDVDDGVWSIG